MTSHPRQAWPRARPTARTGLIAACLLAGLAQAGTAEVQFTDPSHFADAGRGVQAERVRQQLGQHLQALAQQGLPAGQTLQIEVLDIDLAGELRPQGISGQALRVLRGAADWPRIHLRYRLSQGAQLLASGDEQLSDMAYLNRGTRSASDSPLPYEEKLLTDWFHARFTPAAAR